MDVNFLVSIKDQQNLSHAQIDKLKLIVNNIIENKINVLEAQLNILLYLLNKHNFFNHIIELNKVFTFKENNLVHLISAFSNTENIENAVIELNKIIGSKNDHFRFYSPILYKLLNTDINKALLFFNTIKIQISQEGLCKVIYKLSENNSFDDINKCLNKLSNEFNELNSFTLGKECKINNLGTCNNCNNTLKQIDISQEIKLNILNSLKNKFEQQQVENKYNLFIDGANVGFFENGGSVKNIDVKKILTILKFVDRKTYTPCVILHKRHKKIIEKFFNSKVPFNIIYTPFGKDDDLVSLYLAIQNNCMLITNDQYKNHAYALNEQKELNKWYKCHVINYNLQQLFFPKPFSLVIQKINNYWHVPIEDGTCKCYNIEQ
jgi:hypothetical protein